MADLGRRARTQNTSHHQSIQFCLALFFVRSCENVCTTGILLRCFAANRIQCVTNLTLITRKRCTEYSTVQQGINTAEFHETASFVRILQLFVHLGQMIQNFAVFLHSQWWPTRNVTANFLLPEQKALFFSVFCSEIQLVSFWAISKLRVCFSLFWCADVVNTSLIFKWRR